MQIRKIVTSLGVIFLASLLTACGAKNTKVVVPKKNSSTFVIQSKFNQSKKQKKLLANFITDKLVTNQGIYTNFHNVSATKDAANGHQMLSESSGMWLLYLASTHQYKDFRKTYRQVKRTFNQKIQFSYRYDPKTKKKAAVNATLDDLRIIRALQMYATLTHSKSYRHEAAKRFALLKTGSLKNSKLADFYDVKAAKQSSDSALAYYDFVTLHYFESVNKTGKRLYQQQLKIVQDGYLGNAFPLYAASYQLKNHSYSNKALNTSEALETVLHLAEVNKMKPETLNWLKIQIDKGRLYNGYTRLGTVTDRDQAAANYALAAMIFAQASNKTYYQRSMKLAWQSQVLKPTSPIYGGLGDVETTDSYSYNNLVTLLAAEY